MSQRPQSSHLGLCSTKRVSKCEFCVGRFHDGGTARGPLTSLADINADTVETTEPPVFKVGVTMPKRQLDILLTGSGNDHVHPPKNLLPRLSPPKRQTPLFAESLRAIRRRVGVRGMRQRCGSRMAI